ncbi:MAG TPA: hypothetical protein VGO60_18045 [Iamia sp.]|jgi:hypothetical protein|nr:hypothetical protein [Iamia sp.]
MARHALRTGTMILVLTLLGIVGWSPPASAATADLDVTAATITIAGNTFSLKDTGGPCPKADTLQLVTDSPSAGRLTLTGGWTTAFRWGNPPAGQWYQIDISVLTGTIAYSGGPSTYALATVAPNHLILRMDVYEVAEGDCVKDDVACVLHVKLSSTGTYTGTLPAAATGDTLSLPAAMSVAPHVAVSSCKAPWVSWAGQTASLNPFSFVVP